MFPGWPCLSWGPFPSSSISPALAEPQFKQNIDLLWKTWDKCIPTRGCPNLSQITEAGEWGVGESPGLPIPDMLSTGNAEVKSSGFANSLQISTRTITGVKCSQRMGATKYSKQIISAVQAVQPSAPLFSIISYLDSFLRVQTSLTPQPLSLTPSGCIPLLRFHWSTKGYVMNLEKKMPILIYTRLKLN